MLFAIFEWYCSSSFPFLISLLILVVFTYLPTRLHAALTDDGHPHIFNHHPTMYYQPPPLAHCNGFAPATTRLEPIHAELRCRQKNKKKRRVWEELEERAFAVCRLLHAFVFRLRGLKRGRETRPQLRLQERDRPKQLGWTRSSGQTYKHFSWLFVHSHVRNRKR